MDLTSPSPEFDRKIRKRTSPHSSSVRSVKRRRISWVSADVSREIQYGEPELSFETVADRFIPSRPRNVLPLNTTPRTNRIARSFGLTEDRILHFAEAAPPAATSGEAHSKMLNLLRKSASQLFRSPAAAHPTSCTANLGTRKQFILALDGPGIPTDPFAYPLSWSATNCVAVACGVNVYYQNLANREISHLCELDRPREGLVQCIAWGGGGESNGRRRDTLALGTTTGTVQLWDASRHRPGRMGTRTRMWSDPLTSVSAISWQGDSIAVGWGSGSISLFDARAAKRATRVVTGHKGKVYGIAWNEGGAYMASGDQHGGVYIWDSRACRSLTDGGIRGPKMKHKGPVKALAWCPWKPDLLATGSVFPEGKIHIWSTNNSALPGEARHANTPTPLHTISLNTSVTSLQWSPHCKELLSTHGSSWTPPPASSSSAARRSHANNSQPVFAPVQSLYSNSMTVHSYPKLERLVSVTAHAGPVAQSCLSPDGTMLFTICPREEAMKMWKVWGKREVAEKRDSVFDKCAIR